MAFDDEGPSAVPRTSGAAAESIATVSTTSDDRSVPNAEDDLDDEEVQDFRKFASALQKTNVSGKQIRKGEKDFESHGTRLQEGTLEASRRAMHEVLSYTRTHNPTQYVRGWYFPEYWTDEEDEWRNRVVVVEHAKGSMFKSTGRVVRGKGTDFPAWDKTWLLPEEALFMIERGDLHLWWPQRGIEELFPPKQDVGENDHHVDETSNEDNVIAMDQSGLPLSFQAAYALFIGRDDERGKISLEQYQVYANLRRSGYMAFRADSNWNSPQQPPRPPEQSMIWQWILSLLSPVDSDHPQFHSVGGPLLKPGIYRSYKSIYKQIHLIPRYKPTCQPRESKATLNPFEIFYHVFKSRPNFSKANLPPPDFRIAVVNARTTSVPTVAEMSELLGSTPWDPPDEKAAAGKGVGFIYKRLKHGWRNSIIAVVDSGFISYLRFTEMAFGEEKLYETFDGDGGRGGKKGSRSGRGGRGGRGRRGGIRGG